MNKWFGFKVNFKWPHDGFVFGFSIDYYEPTDDLPWESYVFRVAFITMIYDFGLNKERSRIYEQNERQYNVPS